MLLLIASNELTILEFSFLIILLTQVDYDSRHTDTYTVILRDDDQIAKLLNISSSAVYRHKRELIRKGFLQKGKNGYIKINLLPLFLSKNAPKIANLNESQLKELFAKFHGVPQELEEKIANMQFAVLKHKDRTSHSKYKSTFSSKEDLDSFKRGNNQKMNEDVDPDDIPF